MPVDIADVIRMVIGAFFVLLIVALVLAAVIPKKGKWKLVSVGVVLLVFGLTARYVVVGGADREARRKQVQIENEEFRQRLAKAQALFDEHCKTAGEKIYRTVEGVEGVLLVKGRTKSDRYSQYATDPAGDDSWDEGYVETFLRGFVSDVMLSVEHTKNAYRYVDLVDPSDGLRYRYFGEPTRRPDGIHATEFKLVRTNAPKVKPLYGVDWEDVSTQEDRQSWIAGNAIRILDLRSGEVLAERVGYIFDAALGNTDGGRQPWTFAMRSACPRLPTTVGQNPKKWGLARNFAQRVLVPAKNGDK